MHISHVLSGQCQKGSETPFAWYTTISWTEGHEEALWKYHGKSVSRGNLQNPPWIQEKCIWVRRLSKGHIAQQKTLPSFITIEMGNKLDKCRVYWFPFEISGICWKLFHGSSWRIWLKIIKRQYSCRKQLCPGLGVVTIIIISEG